MRILYFTFKLQNNILLYEYSILFIQSLVDCHLCCFYFVKYEMLLWAFWVFLQTCSFLFGVNCRSRITIGPHSNSLNFLGNHKIVFHCRISMSVEIIMWVLSFIYVLILYIIDFCVFIWLLSWYKFHMVIGCCWVQFASILLVIFATVFSKRHTHYVKGFQFLHILRHNYL